jgi:hypothetical protein
MRPPTWTPPPPGATSEPAERHGVCSLDNVRERRIADSSQGRDAVPAFRCDRRRQNDAATSSAGPAVTAARRPAAWGNS